MRKLVAAALVVAATAIAAPAEASYFTISSYQVDLHESGAGLLLWEQNLLTDYDFALTQGQSYTTDLFRVGTTERSIDGDDWLPTAIKVDFNFSTPPPGFGGLAEGVTGAIGWGEYGLGYILWDNPLKLTFGTTGVLEITLSNAYIGVPGYADIAATFKLVREDANSSGPSRVPEPASALLLGLGALGVTLARRRRAA